MKCPFCGVEMLHGYLNCGASLWSERKHRFSLLPDGKEKYALRLGVPSFLPNYVESDCCPECKKIILDSSAYENRMD
ncbi:MAG: PF20097 family protein [Bacillota bacterium]|nr:PF20097 family protein [Bacillota bacterium]